jgi:hypothetical protein
MRMRMSETKRDLPYDPECECSTCRQRGAYDYGLDHACNECVEWAEDRERDA